MHSLTICFGPQATTWVLMFKEQDDAEFACKALEKFNEGVSIALSDDFGQRVRFNAGEITAFMLENMNLSTEAQVYRGVHAAKAQARANKEAMNDPEIRASLRAQNQGPAVFDPVRGYS